MSSENLRRVFFSWRREGENWNELYLFGFELLALDAEDGLALVARHQIRFLFQQPHLLLQTLAEQFQLAFLSSTVKQIKTNEKINWLAVTNGLIGVRVCY